MQKILRLIENSFWLLLGAMSAYVFIRLAWRFHMKKLRPSMFPPRGSVNVRFCETGASCVSDKSFLSRIGKTVDQIEVTVTENEVWIQSNTLITLFAAEFDLEHRIPFGAISSAEIVYKLSRFLRLRFKLPDGSTRHIKLRLQNPEAFLAALTPP